MMPCVLSFKVPEYGRISTVYDTDVEFRVSKKEIITLGEIKKEGLCSA